MNGFKDKYGPWAIIAGAAEGMGEAWSKTLAGKGLNLFMIDNQREKLESLARAMEQEYNIETATLHLDLAEETAAEEILMRTGALECRFLVYNAAYSRVKPFLQNTDADIRHYTDINIYNQLRLVHGFASRLSEEGKGGGIILMSSLAGLIGMQLVAAYAATKAFAWNLAESLHHELKPMGIDVMACVAGATSTPAYLNTNPEYGRVRPLVMKPAGVTEEAISKLGKKARHICGRSNRINYFILTRLLPREMASRMANRIMKKMYHHD